MRLSAASAIVCAGFVLFSAGCQRAAPPKVGPDQVVLEVPGMV